MRKTKSICALKPRRVFLSTSQIFSATTRKKLPFGVGQIGKSFRNEITPGNFTFRTREFEQMELEFFCKPGTDMEWFLYWKDYCKNWLLSIWVLTEENIALARSRSRRNFLIIPTRPPISSICVPVWLGRSCGELRTVPILI